MRVRFVRRTQGLGFTLREVAAFLAMEDGRIPSPSELETFAAAKLQAIDARHPEAAGPGRLPTGHRVSRPDLAGRPPSGGVHEPTTPAPRGVPGASRNG
ncbi:MULTISPECIES: MerR family DNA-binding protein [Myxococcus]|uniref:MerR family DNA-binding protein n=1 Tax=Myxococcus TaxID=32 RepID=UPI00030C63C9|nr:MULTISPECIES: MerR family DNA-binding protein [Myxococcus]NOJ56148.1 MerR family DNA-binding protein [Myxococcus xanthus]QPM81827.1 MerR family DNA-binding protein [Myxococcus xanthus]QVW71077.1 MerR family DNA-binding protein [Myxococcus xanthus DZ2]QZZ50029.1 hypothetical protein MyxoNM_12545 [Myxococcus xanthus]UEO02794.1 MerR family DNA-binding protein [Myxococcus xanthus DZ2]